VSAIIIPFAPRERGRAPNETPVLFRSAVRADDLVMDHADTAPREYLPWCDAQHADPEPA
jgi:hypothetical protein